MFGYSKMNTPRRSDPIFDSFVSPLESSAQGLFRTVQRSVQNAVNTELTSLREKVSKTNPELADSIDIIEKNGKIAYVMVGDGASDIEYGNKVNAPQAHLRKAAEATSKKIEQSIKKLV